MNHFLLIGVDKHAAIIFYAFYLTSRSASIQRIQPPLFKVVGSQTPLGIYTVPFTASLGITIATTVTPTKPIFNNTASGFVDSEFLVSKKYPTTGYITNPYL